MSSSLLILFGIVCVMQIFINVYFTLTIISLTKRIDVLNAHSSEESRDVMNMLRKYLTIIENRINFQQETIDGIVIKQNKK